MKGGRSAEAVQPNDGVAAIEQDAGDTFLIRAEPRGGCDVLLPGVCSGLSPWELRLRR
jgi:hypothetical protein